MPEEVHECVRSVLDDNPEMEESRAWAICHAEMEADVEDLEIATTGTLEASASEMDAFATNTDGWEKQAAGVWTNQAEELLIYDEATVQQQAADFAVDVFRIVQAEDSEMDIDGDVMGIGVDFPNAGAYVDWRIDAWPDDEQLDEPHVSDYGSIDDLEQATGGVVEPLTTVDAEEAASGTTDQQAGLPAECRKCGDNDRMDGSMVCADCADDTEQQAVITGLSQEALDAIGRTYNADIDVVDGEGGAAPTDHESADGD